MSGLLGFLADECCADAVCVTASGGRRPDLFCFQASIFPELWWQQWQDAQKLAVSDRRAVLELLSEDVKRRLR